MRQLGCVDQERLPLVETCVDHINKGLDCRSCETACPSGVQYGKLVEAARSEIEGSVQRPWLTRMVRRFVFGHLLASRGPPEVAGTA